MRLKVTVALVIGVLLAVASAMATPLNLVEINSENGNGMVRVLASKNTTYGVKINGVEVSPVGASNAVDLPVGPVDIKLFNASGEFNPTFEPITAGNYKSLILAFNGEQITLEARKAGDNFSVATPEPGSLLLLGGALVIGLGYFRKNFRK